MEILKNPFRGQTDALAGLADIPYPSEDAATAVELTDKRPNAAVTPLMTQDSLADSCEVGTVWIKDERNRMELGSFKALGAAYVIAHDAAEGDVSDVTYVTASAGNHGMSVAAGAADYGAKAVVYIAETVPEAFAERLRGKGADVVREGAVYEDSMAAAAKAAEENGWKLLSDSSWPGYTERPHRLMEGYLVLMQEVIDEMPRAPNHIFLQAGVGGLAGAAAALARKAWGDEPIITVVEPEAAPCLKESISAGEMVTTSGPVSSMGRLDCKEASLIALKGLARDADFFATISEAEGFAGDELAAGVGLKSTPSGAAGLAALMSSVAHREALGLDEHSSVLLILSEGPE